MAERAQRQPYPTDLSDVEWQRIEPYSWPSEPKGNLIRPTCPMLNGSVLNHTCRHRNSEGDPESTHCERS